MGKSDDFQYFQIITADGLVNTNIEQESFGDPEPEEKKEKKQRTYRKPLVRYKYSGPVSYWGKCIAHCYTAETEAVSEAQARNNILYQLKTEMGYLPNAGGFKLINKIYRVI